MKINDDDIKKSFEQLEVPEPADSSRQTALREAMKEYAKKIAEREKTGKGFAGFLRQMGTTLRNTFTFKGEPIMTQRQFATAGILFIAIGLVISLGPKAFRLALDEPELVEPKMQQARQQDAVDLKPEPGKKAEREVLSTADRQPVAPLAKESAAIRKVLPRSSQAPAEQSREEALNFPAPYQDTAPDRNKLGGLPATSAPASQRPGKTQTSYGYEGDSADTIAPSGYYQDEGRDRFAGISANSLKLVSEEPVSTFSIDVDTSSYSFVRRQLSNGLLPQKNAVRVEEMINYFEYDYPLPEDRSKPFKPTVGVYPTPWNDQTRLLHIGIKGYDIPAGEKPRSNLVFLVDVSGSMNSPDKLPLLKKSLGMLVDTLEPQDRVAIVVYAGAAGTVLEPTSAQEKAKILAALDRLQAGGSTAGGAGIRLAYSLAEMHYDKDAVNRVILATDGDFNVGIIDRGELQSFIEHKRQSGIFLSVLGFGQGNYNDALMQALAQNGNGNAAYIDNLNEARKVLVDEAASTLFPIAADVKIQVEFNPARVRSYRLIGYETRLLNREDFNNDKVDAGEVGSGHAVTAIYEITPVESTARQIDELRYQEKEANPSFATSGEYAFLKIRYKLPGKEKSRLLTKPVTEKDVYSTLTAVPADMRFAAAVAAFGQILRNGPFVGDFTYDDVLKFAGPVRGDDRFGYRAEFMNLVRLAKTAKAM